MSDLPDKFVERTELINNLNHGPACEASIEDLNSKGFEVQVGLTEAYALDIIKMCQETTIKEYCPSDSARRFKDLEAANNYLSKGKLFFLLIKKSETGHRLAGYGWVGTDAGNKDLSNVEVTFAVRISENYQGQGLAFPFSKIIIWGSSYLYDLKGYWLSAWESNGGAVHIYNKLGFVNGASIPDLRISASGETVEDIRVYMTLDNGHLQT